MNPLLRSPHMPIDFEKMTPEIIQDAANSIKAQVASLREAILASDVRDKQMRLVGLDDLHNALFRVLYPIYMMNETHPDAAIRQACNQCVNDLMNFLTDLRMDEAMYKAVKDFAAQKVSLNAAEARYLDQVLRAYERNGFQLDKPQRDKLKKIDLQLNELEISFQKTISDCDDHLMVTERDLDGLSDDFKTSHREADGRYKITIQFPDYDAVMKNAANEDLRKRLYHLYLNRGRGKNLPLLQEILRLRQERSHLLGFDTFAQYTLAEVMAKHTQRVWDFIDELSAKVADKARTDYNQLADFAGCERLASWNKSYISTRFKAERFDLDEEEVKCYFSMNRTLRGLFDLAETLYGVVFRESSVTPVWHEDVRAFEIVENDKVVGRFYLDFFPRPNKYSHAACFGLQSGKSLDDGSYQTPEAALICNFPKPTATKPSLLSHRNVETLFHEFGHLMHHLLTRAPLAALAGTSVLRDFVEMPSQIMENWVWEKAALQSFAKHYETGEPIPDNLIDRMLAVRYFNSGIDTQQQLFYGALDMTYHDGFLPDSPEDTTRVLAKLQAKYTLFETTPDTAMQASFTHLMGYSAGYYGYLWSRVYADDMFSVFKRGGIFEPAVGQRFRQQILAKGDTEEPMDLIQRFLGRKPEMEAFLANLGVGEPQGA